MDSELLLTISDMRFMLSCNFAQGIVKLRKLFMLFTNFNISAQLASTSQLFPSHSWTKRKNLIFIFTLLCGASKGFMKGLKGLH